jgi:hypothetical protein
VLALLIGASVLLASCGNDESGGARGGGWTWEGGQTGSLMPVCGVSPASVERGVPASAPGLVLLPSACDDPSALDALAVRDASGQPIAFQLQRLPGGEILVVFSNGLTPGRYTVGVPQTSNEDGGVDPLPAPDGGIIIGMPPVVQSVEVKETAPPPTGFGTIDRIGGECGSTLQLSPDSSVLPYLGQLSVEVQIDGGMIHALYVTGTLKLVNGVARVELPRYELEQLAYGTHEARVIVRLAGQGAPLETFVLTLDVPCGDEYASEPAESGGFCTTVVPPGSSAHRELATALCAGLALALFALRKRRRTAR